MHAIRFKYQDDGEFYYLTDDGKATKTVTKRNCFQSQTEVLQAYTNYVKRRTHPYGTTSVNLRDIALGTVAVQPAERQYETCAAHEADCCAYLLYHFGSSTWVTRVVAQGGRPFNANMFTGACDFTPDRESAFRFGALCHVADFIVSRNALSHGPLEDLRVYGLRVMNVEPSYVFHVLGAA